MKKILHRTDALYLIVVLLVSLFLYTGISKVTDYTLFKEQIALSPVLSPVASLIAATLPWVEFTVVLLLLIPRYRLRGLYASLALLIAFTIYITAMLAFASDVPCSCGGVIELLSWHQHLVFNGVFIVLTAIGCKLEKDIVRDTREQYAATLKKVTF